jgi:hypothetical protein
MNRQSSPISTHTSDSSSVSLVLTACAISVLFLYLVYSENFVFGSKPGNWVYPYFKKVSSIPLWIPLIVLLSLGVFFVGSKLIRSHEKKVLFGCFLNAVFIQSVIRQVYPFSLGSIVVSDRANSFYTPAMRFSALEILTKYNLLAPSFPQHAATNMPGKILLFELFKPLSLSPEMMGYLILVLSSLGALLLYGICKELFYDKLAAFYAFTLYALIPCKLFFLPILNTVTPVFILLFFYLVLVYIEKKQFWISWILGITLYILIMFEPSPLVIGIILIGILLHAIREKKVFKKDLLKLFINFLLAFLGVHIIFSVLLSFDLIQSFQYILKDAMGFNINHERHYTTWVGENTKEFFYSVGLPVIIIFVYMVAQIFSQWRTLKNNTRWSLENVYVISLLVTFFVVVFLGVNRGEITRLWIYLAVFFQIPASIFVAKINKGEVLFLLVAGTLVAQTILTLHRVGFIIP